MATSRSYRPRQRRHQAEWGESARRSRWKHTDHEAEAARRESTGMPVIDPAAWRPQCGWTRWTRF